MENKTGLWKKTSQKGIEYFAGKITIEDKEYKISLFKNNKQKETQPDYNVILRTEEKEKKKSTDEQVYADFGNGNVEISDEDLAF